MSEGEAEKAEKEEEKVEEGEEEKQQGPAPEGMRWDGQRWLSADGRQVFDEARQAWEPLAQQTPASDQAEIGGLWVHRDPATGLVSVYQPETGAWEPDKDLDDEEDRAEGEGTASEDDELAFQLQQAREERRRLSRRKKEAREQGKAIYVCPKDGAVWEWTPNVGWAPELDDDFLARYQASYGNYKPPTPENCDETARDEDKKEAQTEAADAWKRGMAAKKRKKDPEWFEQDSAQSCNVYVQGLPTSDFDETAFADLMAKCGVLAIDPRSRRPKVKLYKEEDGSLKGDGLATYFKRESVELALKLIDGSRNRDGKPISVSVAKFELKGAFDPSVAKKNKLSKAQKKLAQERTQK